MIGWGWYSKIGVKGREIKTRLNVENQVQKRTIDEIECQLDCLEHGRDK